jgi:hypothetical protein
MSDLARYLQGSAVVIFPVGMPSGGKPSLAIALAASKPVAVETSRAAVGVADRDI